MLRNREGFTLIELLIVVVIIGILAAIALPKFGQTRQQAYVSAMQSDLRNLQTAQEMFYSNPVNEYTYWEGTLEPNVYDADIDFTSSTGVTIVAAIAEDGYTATATHLATERTCELAVGGTGSQGIVCDP
jgi:type IV pilus assembly protein PilA